MSPLRHLLAADARRLRLAIALWITVVAAETATTHAATVLLPFTRQAEVLATVAWLLWMSGLFVSCALVPLVMHLHPAVGSDAFWMTRPIPPRRLAAAKLVLLAAVFVGVPLLANQVAMAIYRLPAGDMARVAIQTTVFRGTALVFLMAAAAWTPNFGRFALLCAAALFGLAALLPLVFSIVTALGPEEPSLLVSLETRGSMLRFDTPGPSPTPALVVAGIVIAGGVLSVVVQYVVRRVPLSAAILTITLALTWFLGEQWPSKARTDFSAPAWAGAPDALQLTADLATINVRPSPPQFERIPRWTARVEVRVTPASPGWFATVGLRHAALELDSGVRFATESESYPVALPDSGGERAAQRALQSVLTVPYVAGEVFYPGQDESVLALRVPNDAMVRSQARTARFHGEFRIDLARLEVVDTMPLAPGAYDDGAFRFAISNVSETSTGVFVTSRTLNAATFLDSAPRPSYSYFLRNKTRNEAVFGSVSAHREHLFLPFLGFTSGGDTIGFVVNAHTIAFGGQSDQQQPPRFEINQKWLEEAQFVIVRARYEGSVRRTLVIDGIPINPTRAGS